MFRFGCGGNDEFYDLLQNEEWDVVGWEGYVFGEKYGSPGPAVVFAFIKEGRIRGPCKDHYDGVVGDIFISVLGNVVNLLINGRQRELGDENLMGTNGAEIIKIFLLLSRS